MTNVLKELIGVTELNKAEFAHKVGKFPTDVYRNVSNGGDMKLSTLKNYADKVGVNVTIEIVSGNSRVKIDLAIVDPPYGIGISSNPVRQKHKKKNLDDETPLKSYFDELKRVSKD